MFSLRMCAFMEYFILSQGKNMCLIYGYQLFLSFIRERGKHSIHATFHPTKPKTLSLDQCERQNAHNFN